MEELQQLRGRILSYEKFARRPQLTFRRYFNRLLRAEWRAAVTTSSAALAVRGGGSAAESERVAAALAVLAKHPYHHPCATRTRKEMYGEITTEGMVALMAHLPVELDSSSVFYDIGSGYGRFALYLALATPCAAVVGVEIDPCRHREAEQLRQQHQALAPQLQLVEGDATQVELRSDMTHLYMCSTCFGEQLCRTILERCPDATRCCVSLRKLDETPGWTLDRTHPVRCTWATSTACYYVRSSDPPK